MKKHLIQPTLFITARLCLFALLFAASGSVLYAQSTDDGFNPNADGFVNNLVVQPDGKILAAGSFSNIGGGAQSGLARLNNTGKLDTSFAPVVSGVAVIAFLDSNNKIFIGGTFTSVSSQTRNRLARLNYDGSLDTSFNLDVSGGTNPSVNAIIVQPDGKILIAGEFTTVGGQAHNRVARLNADGSLDANFNPDVAASVRAMVLQTNGKILIGGTFTSVNSQTRNRLARLNADGSLDANYNPNAGNAVFTIALQPDGKSLVGGAFTTVGGASHPSLARLNTDGSVDAATPNLTGGVIRKIAVHPNGKILVGGGFSAPQGTIYLLRFNPDGTADTQFYAQPDNFVNAIAFQSDYKTIIGGQFGNVAFVKGQTFYYEESRSCIARLETNDEVDRTLSNFVGGGTNSNPNALIIQPDDKIIAAGGDDSSAAYIHRYESDGQSDANFNAVPNGKPFALAFYPNGKILVGGAFTQINNQTAVALARLDATNGSPESSFNPQITKNPGTATIYALIARADGSIFAGGDFSAVGGQTRSGIVKLNTDGTLNSAFTANTNGAVRSIAVRPDGKIVIGGNFTIANGTARSRLAVLDPVNGALDAAQPTIADNQVNTIVVQPDGKIIAGGTFTSAGGSERKGLARFNADGSLDANFNPINAGFTGQVPFVNALALQADGRILIAGQFFRINYAQATLPRLNLARIKIDGTLDTEFGQVTFSPSDYLNAIALEADGKIVFGEDYRLGRVSNPTPVIQNLTVTRSSVTWVRDGASARFSRVSFEYSTDGISYSSIGEKASGNTSETYALTGLNLPKNQNFYIRARGYYLESSNGETISAIETTHQFYLPVPLAANDSYATNEDTTLTVPAPGVLVNDTSVNGLTLTATILSQPAHGTISLNADGSFTYTPAANYNGADSFTYKVNDGQTDSDIATVNITVNAVNDAPVAVNDSYTANNNGTLNISAPGVLTNDTDVDNNPLTAVLVSASINGTLNFNANGSFTYTPNSSYVGTDSFTYRANDGTTNSNLATVTITVRDAFHIVTKTDDTDDGVCDADCSLREAIAVAQSGDTVSFSTLFNQPQTIQLDENRGSLFINKSLTIAGKGANLLTVRGVSGGSSYFRIFTISGSVNVVLQKMTVSNGRALPSQRGGGITNDGGTLTISNCLVTDNQSFSSGAGIENIVGTLNLINSTVSNNISTASFNDPDYTGAGINNLGGTLNITNSTVSGNVRNAVGELNAGGIRNTGAAFITNTTITNNQVGGSNTSAAGIVSTGNGTLTIRDSLVAANATDTSIPDVYGLFNSNGYNLIGNVGIVTGFTATGDKTGNAGAPLNPRLSVLSDFGGATLTHALFSNSPAVNAGNPTAAVSTDQRGVARTVGGRSDIGAFESNFTFSNNPTGTGGNGTLPSGSTANSYSVQFSATRSNNFADYRIESDSFDKPDSTNVAPLTYTVIAGSLPPGLTLGASSGTLSGTPTAGGIYNFTIKVADADGIGGANAYTLNILGPTAASVSIGGRVQTPDGRGLTNATVCLTSANGETRTTRTTSFGYFHFDDVTAGQTIIITIASKRYQFAAQVVSVTEDLTDLHFIAQN